MKIPFQDGRGYTLDLAEEGKIAATLYLYDTLRGDLFGGVRARPIVDDLRALGEVAELTVRVNSPGGDLFDGIAVYNAHARFPAKVTGPHRRPRRLDRAPRRRGGGSTARGLRSSATPR